MIGFLARMSEAKGLETLVDAFLALRREDRVPGLRLRDRRDVHGGGSSVHDAPRGADPRGRPVGSTSSGCETSPGTRSSRSCAALSVLSVPATCGEAFGLYVLEAQAAGVPVVQPRHGAFPELLADLGGGTLCEPDDVDALASALADLLLGSGPRPVARRAGREAVLDRFTHHHMTERVLAVFEDVLA